VFLVGCHGNPAKRRAAYLQSADQYMASEQYQEAVIQYRNALQQGPPSADLFSKLGDAYAHNEQYREAYLSYQKAGTVDPSYLPAQLALAQLMLSGEQYSEAQRLAEEITKQHPECLDAYLILASSLAGEKELDRGVQVLQQDVSPPELHSRLPESGYLLFRKRRHGEGQAGV